VTRRKASELRHLHEGGEVSRKCEPDRKPNASQRLPEGTVAAMVAAIGATAGDIKRTMFAWKTAKKSSFAALPDTTRQRAETAGANS
jgi:hypothetical protein